ncbi:SDR family NAD(P)-dependent oxidoreductase [Sporomusa sphaeroides]|uniref:SDR family NAD(P)-dependent oxidoreductase n=1 Tax=Sporomusa sphaeroides TaxID=47679 RepID=UPI002BA1B68A|nr:glucose 1-dehydrogenase [Sporomusa sphaeroides]HML31847.1 glucose 1-dehydrogenase [Sporomusa sphaeroides]
MSKRVDNKVAIITGGGSGMGQSAVRIFSKEGAKIVIAEINEKNGKAMEDEIRAAGGDALFVKTDVSSEESTAAMAKAAIEKYGRIDIMCHFAGAGGSMHSDKFMVYGKLWEFPLESWDKMIRINLTGTFLVTKAVVPHMLEQKSGSIVYCSSENGIKAVQNADAYTATKGGIVALTRVMAANVGPDNIRVNCICPGGVATPMHGEGWEKMAGKALNEIGLQGNLPINRLGTPDEQAYAALFLASDEASYITGHIMPVDGGWYAV